MAPGRPRGPVGGEGGYDAGMRWLLALVLGVVVLSGAGPARAADDGRVAPPGALVLVERPPMEEAGGGAGPGEPEGVGFVSPRPVPQPLASRVLSLAAGRRVN